MVMADSEALVAGTLAAMLTKYSMDPERPVRIDRVDLEVDAGHNYKPILNLTMQSGAKVRVIIAEVGP